MVSFRLTFPPKKGLVQAAKGSSKRSVSEFRHGPLGVAADALLFKVSGKVIPAQAAARVGQRLRLWPGFAILLFLFVFPRFCFLFVFFVLCFS